MRKVLAVVVVLGVVVVGAAGAIAGIEDTLHNFTSNSPAWNTKGEICAPCHTPHNAEAITLAPLWSRTNSVASYTLYTSTTRNGSIVSPDGMSALCLSCHDGTLALDGYTGGGTDTTKLTGDKMVGTDLRSSHPISVVYDETADGGLNSTNVAAVANLLDGGKVQCSSCHDPHGAGFASLLRASNSASALCLTCHNK